VPHDDPYGGRWWTDPEGARVTEDPHAHQYEWVEQWSEEHGLPYYYNQAHGKSTWDKPVDLAWKRVRARDEM